MNHTQGGLIGVNRYQKAAAPTGGPRPFRATSRGPLEVAELWALSTLQRLPAATVMRVQRLGWDGESGGLGVKEGLYGVSSGARQLNLPVGDLEQPAPVFQRP